MRYELIWLALSVLKVRCVLTFKGCIIADLVKKRNIPLTRADHIRVYRKKNSSIRHEYYSLATKHSHLDKCMLSFTVGGKGRGVYTKLRLINEIKTYVTYLIANSKADIYFFSNIEVGHKLSNPHLHTQIWSDDLNAVRVVYDKVIERFELNAKRCKVSEPQHTNYFYSYVIKDYSKDLNDDELWNLEQTKKRMRKTLGLKLRFYSKSKSKYTQKAYRYFYRAFGILRGVADKFMDYFFSIFFKKERVFKQDKSSFVPIKNKGEFVLCKAFVMLCYAFVMSVLLYAPSTDPPFLYTFYCLVGSLHARHCVFEVCCDS